MLFLPDINILIYAKMTGMPEHKTAFSWLRNALNDSKTTVLVCETTILSFLRITTNLKAFNPPLPYPEAAAFLSDLLTRENVRTHRASPEHFIEVAEFMKRNKLGGNLVMDIHLAILAIRTGAVMVSRDKDFLKIPYLQLLNPFETTPDGK